MWFKGVGVGGRELRSLRPPFGAGLMYMLHSYEPYV